MKMKKILVVTCTKGDGKNISLVDSLNDIKDDVSVVVNTNNSVGLSKVYNKYLTADHLIKHDIVLFVHDDVFIDDMRLKGKLYTATQQLEYDIVGLAGAGEIKIKRPCLWHLMGKQSSWSGAVAHPVADGTQASVTSFGSWPKRCLIMDGLFLAVDLKRVLEAGWRFNENYDFHHYDLASCLDANNKKLRMGTYPIYVTHNSPGLSNLNDERFLASEKQFLREYDRR